MRSTILAGTLLLILVIAGCGDGSRENISSEPTGIENNAGPPNAKAVAGAEAICSEMVASSSQMGAEFSTSSDLTSDALTMTTQDLIKPAIPLVESSSRRLRLLRPEAKSVRFDAYVNLFDPILAVLRERVTAGEAGDPTRAHELELQLIDLSALQRRLARRAGLKTCDVDFIQTFASRGHVK